MCFNPIKTKNSPDPVPCGKCPQCRNRHAQGWAFRIMQEYKKSDSAYFLTLTYNEEEIPRNDQGFQTLDKAHVQNFIKRLRKYTRSKKRSKIKYFAVGEYGTQTERPHYHIIIFNAGVNEIEKAWSYEDTKIAKANRTNSLRKRKRGERSLHA